jgi:hypothetical protein
VPKPLWGVKTRCAPREIAICTQDANFGTPHVRAGRFGRRLLIYRAEAVQAIVPGQARLVLAAGAAPIREGRRDADDVA